MTDHERVGVLLVNTGTTDAPKPAETRVYLREFLSDPRVLDIPGWKRWLILNVFILPFRPARSAEAYEKVWTADGSPLIVLSREMERGLQERLPHAVVETAMRYGSPSIDAGMKALEAADVARIVVVPVFPQYASASTGSVLEKAYAIAAAQWNVPPISAMPAFYDDPLFLDAQADVARPVLAEFKPDYVLMSYHGLPVRQVQKSDRSGRHCQVVADCCAEIGPVNRHCYRAQCIATTRSLASRLGLEADAHGTSFQSRLGRDPWLTPATDATIPKLAEQGVKRLAVMCPSFVVDCLETLEEIGMGGREAFLDAGGEAFELVPCLNAQPRWLDAFAAMIRRL